MEFKSFFESIHNNTVSQHIFIAPYIAVCKDARRIMRERGYDEAREMLKNTVLKWLEKTFSGSIEIGDAVIGDESCQVRVRVGEYEKSIVVDLLNYELTIITMEEDKEIGEVVLIDEIIDLLNKLRTKEFSISVANKKIVISARKWIDELEQARRLLEEFSRIDPERYPERAEIIIANAEMIIRGVHAEADAILEFQDLGEEDEQVLREVSEKLMKLHNIVATKHEQISEYMEFIDEYSNINDYPDDYLDNDFDDEML